MAGGQGAGIDRGGDMPTQQVQFGPKLMHVRLGLMGMFFSLTDKNGDVFVVEVSDLCRQLAVMASHASRAGESESRHPVPLATSDRMNGAT